VLTDLSGWATVAASSEDYLIPSCILNATISGLVSRSVYDKHTADPIDFHGCLYYEQFVQHDLSNYFIDAILARVDMIRPVVVDGLGTSLSPDNERGLTVRPELVEGGTVKPFMVRQGSPERSRRVHHERLNLKLSRFKLVVGGFEDLLSNRQQLQTKSQQFLHWIAEQYGITQLNYIKPGIGEATRVLLRREAQLLLLQDLDSEATRHLRWLAESKSIPIAVFKDLPYRAVALIKEIEL
jgi:hypothetical protein